MTMAPVGGRNVRKNIISTLLDVCFVFFLLGIFTIFHSIRWK